MNEFEQVATLLSLSMGAAWASGINLYAAVLVLGLGGATGNIELPANLEILQDPMVLMAAGLMYGVEFFADKIPGVDTGWDAIHTFVRIPAGAILASSAVGDVGSGMQLAAGLLGGGVSAATHTAKAGTRVMINTSPEPVSNWTASITEDLAVIGGLWVALNHPVLFMIALIAFLLMLAWLLPKLLRAVRMVFRKLGQMLGLVEKDKPVDAAHAEKLAQLKKLHLQGALTAEEYANAVARLETEQMAAADTAATPTN